MCAICGVVLTKGQCEVVVVVVGVEVEVEVKPPMPVLRRFKQDDLNTCHFGPNSTKRQSHVISKRRCVRRSLFWPHASLSSDRPRRVSPLRCPSVTRISGCHDNGVLQMNVRLCVPMQCRRESAMLYFSLSTASDNNNLAPMSTQINVSLDPSACWHTFITFYDVNWRLGCAKNQ